MLDAMKNNPCSERMHHIAGPAIGDLDGGQALSRLPDLSRPASCFPQMEAIIRGQPTSAG